MLQISKISADVETALDGIRPYLMADGGNVKVLEITPNNEVILEFTGTCGTCPMSAMTFKAGVEDAIRKSVPMVSKVTAINVADVS